MIRPTVEYVQDGNKTIKLYSYVVTLCEIGGSAVHVIRMDGYKSKYDAQFRADLEANCPSDQWRIKNILKLYDEDFEEKEENKWHSKI